MKRAFVFLVLAPVTVFFTVLFICAALAGARYLDFASLVAMVLAIFALPMSVIGWITDEFLARAVSIAQRVCLTALAGAAVAAAEILAVFNTLFPPSIMTTLAIGGAIVMAACSLLSNEYVEQRYGLEPASA